MITNIYAIGVFDMFHIGHLNHLKKAKELEPNSKLIVGVNSDQSVIKNKRKTIIPDNQRKEIIQSLKFVDEVFLYDNLNQIEKLKELNINIFAIGPEYNSNPYYQEMMDFCQQNNIRIEIIPRTKEVSTTDIIRKCFQKKEQLEKKARDFWKSHKSYPNYSVDIVKRRDYEVEYLLPFLTNCQTLLDLGCGDGSLVKILSQKTNIQKFYAYELSENLLTNLNQKEVNAELEMKVLNLTKNTYTLPSVDVVVFAGVIPFLFEDSDVLEVITKLETPKLFVRAPCTHKENNELVDTFSKDLNAEYTALYRTKENIQKLLSTHFKVKNIFPIYPDELESKYGTRQYYFECDKI